MEPSPPSALAPLQKEISREQWHALAAGTLGWALDAFDVMLYSVCLASIMAEWHHPPSAAGFIVTLTLLASSLGGIAFGVIADRIGRKPALMITVLAFSLFSGLSALAQDLWQLALCRALLGVGMGGEWAAGALLVSESWPARHRGKAIGLMQSGWSIGYLAASLAGALLLPRLGWRPLFLLGIAPALFILWIRSAVREPALWQRAQRQPAPAAPPWSLHPLFAADLARKTLLGTLTSAMVMFGYWGLFSWLPGFLALPPAQGGAGLGIARASVFVMPVMVGAFFGYVSFGFIADRFGRRPTFAAFLLASAALVWLFAQARDPRTLLLLGPPLGFFGSGYFSAFGALLAELFPTRVRGAGVGLCYNGGRLLSAAAPTVIGALSLRFGLGGALALLALSFVGAAGTIYLLPETRAAELT